MANRAFSLKGRVGRKTYAQWVGAILAFRIAAAVVVAFRPDWVFLIRTDFLLIVIAIFTGKRMKDFGMAAAWGWIAVLLISFVLPIGGMILLPQPHVSDDPFSLLPFWVGIASTVLLFALVIVVGIKKGDPGPNRYGDPPDEAAAAAATATVNS
jgi:uncharacterized membrane protein YhaH (DUF805 family)